MAGVLNKGDSARAAATLISCFRPRWRRSSPLPIRLFGRRAPSCWFWGSRTQRRLPRSRCTHDATRARRGAGSAPRSLRHASSTVRRDGRCLSPGRKSGEIKCDTSRRSRSCSFVRLGPPRCASIASRSTRRLGASMGRQDRDATGLQDALQRRPRLGFSPEPAGRRSVECEPWPSSAGPDHWSCRCTGCRSNRRFADQHFGLGVGSGGDSRGGGAPRRYALRDASWDSAERRGPNAPRVWR
jgi:hypothetical protein